MRRLLQLFFLIILPIIILSFSIQAQVVTSDTSLNKKNTTQDHTFFEIQNNFNNYWNSKEVNDGYYIENGIRKKAYGWKQFKRWEYYWSNRIDPTSGEFPNKRASDFYIKREKPLDGNRSTTGNWTSIGPTYNNGGYYGVGRLNCVAFRPGDNNTFYVGSPSGGLWKTTNGGSNWTVLTDQNAVLGVSDAVVIAGSTTNSDIIYIGTGDRDGGSMHSLGGGQYRDNNSIGVLKSVDGGATWATTGLTFSTNEQEAVNKMLVDPNNSNVLYAATSDGLYKSTDAAATWSKIIDEHFKDIKFKPTDAQTIYGSHKYGKIYLSTNGGNTWSKVFDKYSNDARRIELAVSANEPNWVYAVVVDNNTDGLFGIYKSTNSGANYNQVFNGRTYGNNLLGGNCDGTPSNGQGYYDLAIAADPGNANILFVGGVNTWKSIDGGDNWTLNNQWSDNCNATTVHADHHFFAYQNGTSTLFDCNDGGLYKTTNNGYSWSNIDNGLVISQMYRLGVSQIASDEIICGLQDNGTKELNAGIWTDVNGGDGMECLIDYTNENIQYAESQKGSIKRTTNHWATKTRITKTFDGAPINGLDETGYWVTPYIIDPINHNTLYLGLNNIWKSTNKGDAWTKISNINSSSKIRSMAMAPSNNQILYVADPDDLWVTSNGGSSWSNITGSLPVSYSSITYISVKHNDPNTVWVSFGQYNSHCVYQTTNKGASWTNISAGIQNIPIMCVIQNKQNTSQNELYAATDVGIYVKIGTNNWTLFSNGLPNVVVNELEIYYNTNTPNLSRIRAATSGRGLWESELYTISNPPPAADFSASSTNISIGESITFTDQSSNNPTSWNWTFTGGTPNNSTNQNPTITYNTAGTYSVSLTATNTGGSNVETKTNYITVNVPANLQLSNGILTNVGSTWQTITLSETYTSPVVVCAANYSSGNVPAVARVRNASGNTFEVKVQNPQQISLSGYTVHYMVVEEGVYTDAADGVKMEAHKYTSTITDKKHSWVGESKSYSNTYSSPIVLGQVMTANDVDWSVFWARGSATANPPSSSAFYTGKHVAEDTDAIRSNEEIGYIVIEAGTGTLANVGYSTGLGNDIVQGFDDSPPYIYTLSGLSTAGVAIVSSAAMDGGDGGWPALYGDSPVSTTSLNLTIDEDQIGDTERAHTTEQVAYIVFEGAASAPIAAFTANNVTPNVGATVTFTDSSTGNPTSWAWTFSPTTVTYVGGTSATDQNPQLTFDAAGNYTVTLTATNANGSDDEIKTNYIVVSTSSCPSITSYPYTQNFDAWGLSSPTAACTSDGSVPLSDCWTNVVGDDIDWDIHSGGTASGGTGPSGDHTGGGNYLYTEASNCFNQSASILSPTFDLTSLSSAQLNFWYNMYGANMGTMSIQVSTDGGANWSANIWSLSGDQGTNWHQATVSLSQYVSSDNVVIRFTGLTGSNWKSDMAIDDFVVEVSSGQNPVQISYTDFESNWDVWTDGGSDCERINSSNSPQGSYSADIQDNSNVASSFYYTNGVNVHTTGYVQIDVEFTFQAVSMDNSSEDFWLQYYDGSSWITIEKYAVNSDFDNNKVYEVKENIPESQYNFPTNMKIRFMCDASGNKDDVYIDEIRVTGLYQENNDEYLREISRGNNAIGIGKPDFVGLKIYPNPVDGNILNIVSEEKMNEIYVYSIIGLPIKSISVDMKTHYKLNVANLDPGLYILRVRTGEEVETQKFIKR